MELLLHHLAFVVQVRQQQGAQAGARASQQRTQSPSSLGQGWAASVRAPQASAAVKAAFEGQGPLVFLATPTPVILMRHILPNAMAPLIVQGTFIAASAVLTEAILSFLGLGLPADIPTWGNIMAEGRVQFTQFPGNVLYPALFLVPTVLAINLLGDGLRDVLDPKFAKRGA